MSQYNHVYDSTTPQVRSAYYQIHNTVASIVEKCIFNKRGMAVVRSKSLYRIFTAPFPVPGGGKGGKWADTCMEINVFSICLFLGCFWVP